MSLFLAVALIAWQGTYYTAKVTSFGCTSIEAVHELEKIRSDRKAFQMALMEKQIYGECVTILQGTLVQGSIEASDPPGYEAPLDDFEIKATEGKKRGSTQGG